MPSSNEAPLGSLQQLFGDVQKKWGWLLALGIVFIILGTIGLGMSFALTLASVLVFGWLLIIGGVLQIVDVFQCKGWKSIAWHVLIAVLYVLAGVSVITDPLLASSIITLILAAVLVVVGILRIILAIQHRDTNAWGWALVAGIISVVLGGMIYAQWPVSGLWVIGLFVAIELIINGWSYVFIALAARGAAKASSSSAPQAA